MPQVVTQLEDRRQARTDIVPAEGPPVALLCVVAALAKVLDAVATAACMAYADPFQPPRRD